MSRSAILAIRIITDAAGAKKGLDSAASSSEKFASGVSRASVPAAAALAGMGAAAWKAAGQASALEESTNAVSKTFGAAAAQVTAFGDDSARSVGLAQSEFQSLAVSTGAMLTNMGLSQDEAAASTIALTERAADMASVYNTDVATALEAINSGLRGESEPLRAFGVGLSDATIKGKALEMGLYSGKGALDASAKAAATQALIMEQTAKTQGDFAETSDGAANSQRILTAEFTDASAELGTALLPAISTVTTALTGMVRWLTQNRTVTKTLIVVVGALAAGIIAANVALKIFTATQKAWKVATVAMWYAQVALNLAMAMNPIMLVVIAIAALVAGLILAYKKSETFRAIVDKLARVLMGSLKVALNFITGAFEAVTDALQSAWNWITKLIGKVGDLVSKMNPLKALGSIFDKITPGIAGASFTFAAVPGATGPTARATVTTASGTEAYVTEEQIARAVYRVLMRSDARNGRLTTLGVPA